MSGSYLTVAAIIKDERDYIEEWLAFHEAVGVEHFFLYDNDSTDGTTELLYGRENVTVYDWPGERQQLYAYANALLHHESHWLAFLDADEFLFSPTYQPVTSVLREFERYDAVGACWAVYGTSLNGARHRLVGPHYCRRAEQSNPIHRHVKSIVQPSRVAQQVPSDPHHFACNVAVDEQERPLEGPFARSATWQLLRVNHYIAKSIPEAHEKMRRPRADNGELRGVDLTTEDFNAEFDNAIEPYAPLVEARLMRG